MRQTSDVSKIRTLLSFCKYTLFVFLLLLSLTLCPSSCVNFTEVDLIFPISDPYNRIFVASVKKKGFKCEGGCTMQMDLEWVEPILCNCLVLLSNAVSSQQFLFEHA